MNIAIFTNTFTPHVGGVARSVEAFVAEYRQLGHKVLVVAPEFADMPQDETDVVRIAAIQNFNASDFSVALPIHDQLSEILDAFAPDIIHSQHPFLLGMTALRTARYRKLPLVFTHHTLYEQYTHYIPGDSATMQRFAIELATRYANLCDQVIAPSQSIAEMLQQRGVTTPVTVIPTGVSTERFARGNGEAVRQQLAIPADAVVIGHLGRLAPEKNLEFLAHAVANVAVERAAVHFLVVGTGPSEAAIRQVFAQAGISNKLHMAGILQQQQLADALHAMDIFAFASGSETQGIVLAEAMAAGLPVVALDAPGVREVVKDGDNGLLLYDKTTAAFSTALRRLAEAPVQQLAILQQGARDTADAFSMACSADKALQCFSALLDNQPTAVRTERDWEDALEWVKAEWDILRSVAVAGTAAVGSTLFADSKE
ncbi:glycosyltransferase involved in cell wall biosynthesis [Rheinheimera pacifica]|uniref:glycosyltransferase n=1 Tax=Rheinheimera pacifica TaxID=173990 RepID=UPI002866F206|nr:glycosyltransferase [Rheinheimera pacifica]MDR6984853.1 glycosyltransferase involved in cell wall biosynthesis [Rheinheimera pacifica]